MMNGFSPDGGGGGGRGGGGAPLKRISPKSISHSLASATFLLSVKQVVLFHKYSSPKIGQGFFRKMLGPRNVFFFFFGREPPDGYI